MATKAKKPTQPKVSVENPNDKRTAAYWLADDNAQVLTGLALQCRTHEELAKMLGVHPVTIRNWRHKHEVLKDAIDIGREYADAMVIKSTFMDAVNEDGASRRLWWQYRIAPKEIAYSNKVTAEQTSAEGQDEMNSAKLIEALNTKAAEVWPDEPNQDAEI